MKDHMVVAMPNRETLGRPVNVEEFVISQNAKTPTSRNPVAFGQMGGSAFDAPKSPGRHVSRSCDIVQEVYDRMGVNYVRGQDSLELYNKINTISIDATTKKVTQSPSREASIISNMSELSNPFASRNNNMTSSASVGERQKAFTLVSQRDGYASLHQRSFLFDDDDDEAREDCDDRSLRKSGVSDDVRCSLPSGKSVKSMLSVFGGGKRIGSITSSNLPPYKPPPKIVSTIPNQKEKVADLVADDIADETISVVSIDTGPLVTKEPEQQQQSISREASPTSRASFQDSVPDNKLGSHSSKEITNDHSTEKTADDIMDKIVEEKVEAKLAILNAQFEEKVARLEAKTNAKLQLLESKLNDFLKAESSIETKSLDKFTVLKPVHRNGRRNFSYESVRL